MQNRFLIQSLVLCLVAIYLTWASDATSQSARKPRGFALEQSTLVRERRETTPKPKPPKKKPTTPKPGFFKTLFSVIYEQHHDTRGTIAGINKLVNDNFLPEPGTVEATTAVPGSNVTTTEDNRITREEFNKIIMRNLRGLRRLFRIELKEALVQSEPNYNEFRMNVSKEIGKFL